MEESMEDDSAISQMPTPLTTEIPDGLRRNLKFVYFNVQTTGLFTLDPVSEILQLAAVVTPDDAGISVTTNSTSSAPGDADITRSLEDYSTGTVSMPTELHSAELEFVQFDRYIKPSGPIPMHISKINHFTYFQGTLRYRDRCVETEDLSTVLGQFVSFLSVYKPCVLVAHNALFDSRILLHYLTEKNLLDKFKAVCQGFCDTLPALQNSYPHRIADGKGHKRLELYTDIVGLKYETYNAVEHSKAIQHLCPPKSLTRYFFSVGHVEESIRKGRRRKKYLETYRLLIKQKVLSKGMATKLAETGLSLTDLREAYRDDPDSGLERLLSECNASTGKPRITKDKKVISKLHAYMTQSRWQ